METNSRKSMTKKIAILDCFAGISGDMTLGALIDCGVPDNYLRSELSKLKITDWDLEVNERKHHHIHAKHIVIKSGKSQKSRNFTDIIKMIQSSDLSDKVKKKSQKAFTILGKAEAKIHGVNLNSVHFHEVGAIDSIIDLVGSIIGFEYLTVHKIYHTPIPLGTGFTKTDHGIMPVPAPAALEILRGIPIIQRTSGYEMTTPTGATIIKTLSHGVLPENLVYEVESIGYGAGNTETDLWPNTLRLMIARSKSNLRTDYLMMIETNIDDMNPEIYPFLIDKLFGIGARDVYLSQVIMKKGRPGVLLSVLTEKEKMSDIKKEIFLNTTTLGIRMYPVKRIIVKRKSKYIKTEFGNIKVKSILLDEKEIFRPEYEECKKIAEENRLSILDVYKRIEKLSQTSDE